MNDLKKKKLIQIIIVFFCFGGTGIILYNGFFKYKNAPVANITSSGVVISRQDQSTSKKIETILPNGSELDFGSLNRPNVQYGTTVYENKVSTSEIGMLEHDLISVKILENLSTQ
jgi:co-chaperonin GroES (HSP10)